MSCEKEKSIALVWPCSKNTGIRFGAQNGGFSDNWIAEEMATKTDVEWPNYAGFVGL